MTSAALTCLALAGGCVSTPRPSVSLSVGGREEGIVHVYDVESGRETGDVIARVNGGTAGGSVAWERRW